MNEDNKKLYSEFYREFLKNPELLERFKKLCSFESRDKGSEESLLEDIKAGKGIKIYKKVSKFVKRLSYDDEVSESDLPGPTVTSYDIGLLKARLDEFLGSPAFYGNELPKRDKIRVDLFGSLVTGFGGKNSRHQGIPTDIGRVSDIDFAIILGKEQFESFISEYIRTGGIKRSPPLDGRSSDLGPFRNMFKFITGLKIAGRKDRKMTVVFMEKGFFLNFRRKELYKRIISEWVGPNS